MRTIEIAISIIILLFICSQTAFLYADEKSELFMTALDKTGMAEPLNKAGIKIFGYAEGGWFYDATAPRKGSGPTFIGYNNFTDDQLDELINLYEIEG